jgi:peptide/nickel transport system permease protein
MNPINFILSTFIDLYVKIRDKINPEWSLKNSARISEWKLMVFAFSQSKIGVAGGLLVTIFVVLAIIGPLLAYMEYDYFPILENPDYKLIPPNTEFNGRSYILGTDWLGRDVLSMILYGVRISVVLSFIVIILGVPLGIILGLLSGYLKGYFDEFIMRLTDIFLAFPGLILAIAFASVLPSRIYDFFEANTQIRDFFSWIFALKPEHSPHLAAIFSLILALVIVWWPGYARIVRASTLSVTEQVFIEAAKSLGLSKTKILSKHVLPNIIAPVLVLITFDLGTVPLLAAALSFLGLGPQEPVPELGRIISQAGLYFPEKSWWIVVSSGIFLFLLAFGWNLLGDSLRDVLDPRTRRAIEFKKGKK